MTRTGILAISAVLVMTLAGCGGGNSAAGDVDSAATEASIDAAVADALAVERAETAAEAKATADARAAAGVAADAEDDAAAAARAAARAKAAAAEPDVSSRSSCQDDFPLVFLTSGGMRLVGEVDVWNDGDASAEVGVKFSWLFFGGGSASMTKRLSLDAGAHRNVGFVKPATYGEIERMVGHQVGDTLCFARVTLLN